jgi:tetratricopeptide (TPR) repeat protein
MSRPAIGDTVSHFELLERLGGGGMAVVYKALDLRLGRPVALKFLASGMEANEEARLRFLLEARAVSALDHPNVCTLYEIDETDDGQLFLVMAYVEGGTLRDRLTQGSMEPLEAALLAAQVADGLGAAHARGIVHRDIKPGNLLLGDGLVKIADFGVARLADQAPITRAGQTVGTYSYMAPEQLRGEEVTPTADLWSLGVVLYEAITGKRPFRGRSEPDLIRRILETEAPPLGEGGPRLGRIVARALEKSLELRYTSAREMQEDLLAAADALAGGEPDTWPGGFLPTDSPVAPRSSHGGMEIPVFHNLPFPPIGDLLKGRHEELQTLAQALAEDSPAGLQAYVIHGLGGIGKTRLAIEYAWKFGRRYRAAFFVLADSPDGLDSGLAALANADLLDLRERAIPAQNEVRTAVLRWLRENPGWLLILDNVDTREARLAVTKLLPALTTGRVLITSRRRDWPTGVRRKALDPIRLQQAAEFLLERTGEDRRRQPDDAEQALRLAELLDGLPLAMEQAGAYIVHRQVSFREYLEAWEGESDSVLGWYDEGVMQYPASLAITWQRTFHELSPTAQAVLRLVSFLAPDPIPLEMIKSGEEVVRQAAALLCEENGQAGPVRLVRSEMAELSSLSLISGQGELFTMHRLMQEVVRNRIPEERRTAWIKLVLELMAQFAPLNPQEPVNWPAWNVLRIHAAEVVAHAGAEGALGSCASSQIVGSLGIFLYSRSLYAEAEPLLRKTLELDEKVFGAEHIEIAYDLGNLALLLKDTGRPQEAELLMRRAVEIARIVCGEQDPVLSSLLNGLALTLMESRQYEEAEELLNTSLLIDRNTYGEDHSAVGRDLHNLALALSYTGRNLEAERLIRRALEIGWAVYGQNHPLIARRLQILGSLLRNLGRPDEAEPLARQALEIFDGMFGPDHAMTQSARRDLDTLTAA